MDSNILVRIEKEMNYGGQLLQIEEYATDYYVLSNYGQKKVFYLKEKNEFFAVDETLKVLRTMDVQQQTEQINAMRLQINDLQIEINERDDNSKSYQIHSQDNGVMSVEGEIHAKPFEAIAQTAYVSSQRLSQQGSVIPIDIAENEVIESSSIKIKMNTGVITNQIALKKIEKLSSQIDRFDYLLNYPIA